MRSATLAVLTLAALASTAAAQTSTLPPSSGKGPPPIGPTPPSLVAEPVALMIAAFDTDGDARVTRAELTKGVAHSFAVIDTLNTGKMGYIAFADWAEKWLGNRTALPSPFDVDTNGDNQITLAELDANFQAIFTRLDKDNDNALNRAELLTVRADLNRGPQRRGKAGGTP